MWKCPECGRSFKNTAQRHRCERVTTADQLKHQSADVLEIYKRIIRAVDKLGPYTFSPIKDYIMLKHTSTFLTIKPRKKYLDISFFLAKKTEEFPVFASLPASKHRVRHAARMEKPADVTRAVVNWIKASYQLTSQS
jgi:hypothetical protein